MANGTGAVMQPQPGQVLNDDDHVGHVSKVNSSSVCLTLTRGGNLEVWSGQ